MRRFVPVIFLRIEQNLLNLRIICIDVQKYKKNNCVCAIFEKTEHSIFL